MAKPVEQKEPVEWPEAFFAKSRRDEGAGCAPQPKSNDGFAEKGPVPITPRSADSNPT